MVVQSLMGEVSAVVQHEGWGDRPGLALDLYRQVRILDSSGDTHKVCTFKCDASVFGRTTYKLGAEYAWLRDNLPEAQADDPYFPLQVVLVCAISWEVPGPVPGAGTGEGRHGVPFLYGRRWVQQWAGSATAIARYQEATRQGRPPPPRELLRRRRNLERDENMWRDERELHREAAGGQPAEWWNLGLKTSVGLRLYVPGKLPSQVPGQRTQPNVWMTPLFLVRCDAYLVPQWCGRSSTPAVSGARWLLPWAGDGIRPPVPFFHYRYKQRHLGEAAVQAIADDDMSDDEATIIEPLEVEVRAQVGGTPYIMSCFGGS